MKKFKYFKPNFSFFLINTLFVNIAIYLFQFYFKKDQVDYFLCTNIRNYNFSIFSKNIELIYPHSCDIQAYQDGVVNFLSFLKIEEYVYQGRPLFVFYIYIFYLISKLFFGGFLQTLPLIKLSFFLGQLVLTSVISLTIYKILRLLDVNVRNNYFFIPAIISMSPMFKWHIYESTSMTFTFLIFIYGLLITLENKNKNITFINIGLLFLVHRSAIVIFVFFVLYNNFKNRKFSLYLNKFVLVAIPISIFYFLVLVFGDFSDHNAEGYRQFVWLFDYFGGKQTLSGGYFCQTPKAALICYSKDFFSLLKYLAAPSLFVLTFLILKFKSFSSNTRSLLIAAFAFSCLINFFWLFIGWYPPIRFSYYGFGNLICFLLIFLLNNFQERAARIIYMMAITSYFLFLNHWNSPEIISYTNYIKVSFFLFIASFALESSKK
jgi:hypothetical protein